MYKNFQQYISKEDFKTMINQWIFQGGKTNDYLYMKFLKNKIKDILKAKDNDLSLKGLALFTYDINYLAIKMSKKAKYKIQHNKEQLEEMSNQLYFLSDIINDTITGYLKASKRTTNGCKMQVN